MSSSDNKIYETQKGFIIERPERSRFCVYLWGVIDYDGIRERGLSETTFDYDTGLYTSLDHVGRYFANYFPERYKGREKALKAAKELLRIK